MISSSPPPIVALFLPSPLFIVSIDMLFECCGHLQGSSLSLARTTTPYVSIGEHGGYMVNGHDPLLIDCYTSSSRDDSSGLYEKIKMLKFGGAVEGMDFAKASWKEKWGAKATLFVELT